MRVGVDDRGPCGTGVSPVLSARERDDGDGALRECRAALDGPHSHQSIRRELSTCAPCGWLVAAWSSRRLHRRDACATQTKSKTEQAPERPTRPTSGACPSDCPPPRPPPESPARRGIDQFRAPTVGAPLFRSVATGCTLFAPSAMGSSSVRSVISVPASEFRLATRMLKPRSAA